MKMKSLLYAVFAVITVITAGGVQAASINWSSLGTVNNASDVLNIGTIVQAQYAGGSGAETVNGVTFQDGFTSYATAFGATNGTFSGDTGNTAYNTILNSFAYDGSNPGVLTLNSLNVGGTYEVELWALDDRSSGGISSRTENFDDNVGHDSATITLGSNTIILGTFTADATTQIINVNGVDQSAHNLNAFEVVATPEPSTWAMLATGFAVLLGIRRWKSLAGN